MIYYPLFLTGSATLYRDHVFTFDGNYVFIPKLRGARRRCAYLLARDFYTGNFTILYDGHQLTLKTKESSVLFDRIGKVILFRSDYQGTCTHIFDCKLEIKVITRNIKQYYSNTNAK